MSIRIGPGCPAYRLLLWVSLTSLGISGAPMGADAEEAWYEYRLRWSFVTVGSVVIRSLPGEQEGHWHYELSASTNRWMDRILRARTEVVSHYDEVGERSLHYRRTENADRNPEVYEALFRPREGVVQFVRDGEPRVPIAVPPGVVDPLSIMFQFRRIMSQEVPDNSWKIPVTDGRRFEVAEVEFWGREEVRLPAGRFKAIVVEADLGEVRAVFQRPEGARVRMWFSDDGERIPLRLESSLLIGHFAAELTGRSKAME